MILVAIGANLPDAAGRDALGTCRWAAAALDSLPGLRVRALSRWYASRPVPEADQPDYVNGVAHLEQIAGWLGRDSGPTIPRESARPREARAFRIPIGMRNALVGQSAPLELLERLHGIEQRAGRVRGAPNAARTLDLDLVAFGDAVSTGPALVLPHPRAHLRPFVLAPLRDVAPGWRHPTLGAGVSELLAAAGPNSLSIIEG